MDRYKSATQPLLEAEDADDLVGDSAAGQLRLQQHQLAGHQEQQLERLGTSVGTLRTMSHQIGSEVDDQAVMIDDLSHDVDSAQGKMETTMNRMAKVLRITNDRRQWTAIVMLSTVLVIIILLFFVL